jgi:L-aminopeptidase/D-esterase-like protein
VDTQGKALLPFFGRFAMRLVRRFVLAALSCLAATAALATAALAGQDELKPNTAINGSTLTFDWPALKIGIGSYEEGPTGLTIFRFPEGAAGVVDVRGGAPGSANTDLLRVGSEDRFIDAIVFTGGGVYGHEAIAAVATGLKEKGEDSGLWSETAIVAGSEIYDFQGARLNEIYPDKRLGRAALDDLRPGSFPLGAQGAGRMATQGGYFGCAAHSGQGGAFRQIGDVKIAVFTVVNALGTITDRDGRLVRCAQEPGANAAKTAELLSRVPVQQASNAPQPVARANANAPTRRNTTLSLVVTNKKLSAAQLQRLAIQVHTSMARAIQPFSTADDGDMLFALSTQEVDAGELRLDDLSTVSGELMWDAVLASVPAVPAFTPPAEDAAVPEARLSSYEGTYVFGPNARIRITTDNGRLMAEALTQSFQDLRREQPVPLRALSDGAFYVDGRYRTRITFTRNLMGRVNGATVNPGQWQQAGVRE